MVFLFTLEGFILVLQLYIGNGDATIYMFDNSLVLECILLLVLTLGNFNHCCISININKYIYIYIVIVFT